MGEPARSDVDRSGDPRRRRRPSTSAASKRSAASSSTSSSTRSRTSRTRSRRGSRSKERRPIADWRPRGTTAMIDVRVRRPVRRLRLRHAAVPAVGRAVGDARDDEFRQPGALHLRHDRRLRHRDADEQLRLAVPGHPARRLYRRGRDQRGVRAHHVPAALPRQRPRPVPAHHRAGVRLGRDRGLCLRHHPAAGISCRATCAVRCMSAA